MADGARFDIDIQAKSLGVDASTDQLNELAAKIEGVGVVATKFDTVVAAATKRLAEVSTVAASAASALGEAQSRYAGLEREADRAAKALEKATAAGASAAKLDKLRVQAESTAAAMHKQAGVVSELEAKSKTANAQQSKLAASLKTLEGRQRTAADAAKKGAKASDVSASKLAAMGKAGALAAAAIVVGVAGAVVAMGKFALASNPMAMMRLNIASQRLQFSFMKLFRGLDLSKFLGGIDRLGALFDTTNASGQALKLAIETVMQPLFDAVGKAEPYVAEFFKGIIHGALRVYIAILRLEIAILKAMSPETRAEVKKLVDKVFTLENAFALGTAAGVALAVVLGVIALAMLGIAVSVAVAMVPFFIFWGVVYGIVEAITHAGAIVGWFKKKIGSMADAVADVATDLWDAGANIVEGLWLGIKSKWKIVIDKIKGLADLLPDVVKKALGIASPSKIMMQLGSFTAAGLVMGIDGGVDDVREASAGLGEAAASGAEASAAAGVGAPANTIASPATSAPTRTVHIEHLHIGDSSVAQSNLEAFKRACDEWLEGVSLSIGGGEVPA